jgi:transaldolase
VPDATLEAFRTEGNPGSRRTEDLAGARAVMQGIGAAGIDFAAVTKELEDEGVAQFQQAYVGMLEAITKRHDAVS